MLDTILDIAGVASICLIGLFIVSYYRMKNL